MGLKFSLCLIIFFVSLSSEIGVSSQNARESSLLHIRKKRLIDHSSSHSNSVPIRKVPYIVDIRKNGSRNCGGTILSTNIIITAAHCLMEHATYTVVSGSGRTNKKGIHHNVTRIIINQQYIVSRFMNDLAMLKISPDIDLTNSPNRHIELHDGNVKEHSFGVISGWGCIALTPTSIIFPDDLRSITVPILDESTCQRLYHGSAPITNKVICTYDGLGQRSACKGDSGSPLVVDGRLLGVHAWNKEPLVYPDVHIKVSEYYHTVWISVCMKELNGEF